MPEQKQRRIEVCGYWLKCIRMAGDEWWKMIITSDKSWIYTHDLALKQQSTELV